eukprot:6174847-Pleurochrysis_carterae.AAC.1
MVSPHADARHANSHFSAKASLPNARTTFCMQHRAMLTRKRSHRKVKAGFDATVTSGISRHAYL